MSEHQGYRPRTPSPFEASVQRVITRLHSAFYQATGGLIGRSIGKVPALLLTTTGRKSGKPRTTPLTYLKEGDTYIVVASNGGTATHPLWFLNLQAHPEASIQVGGSTIRVRAVQATPAEKARLWPLAVNVYAGYTGYQQRTARDIPLVLLHPIAA